ncbi:UNVERIFIED_CONTAM: hypothetical protein GTU68_022199 [Idotea baltica]|nr:hypothetical protein [Idotea baltica]
MAADVSGGEIIVTADPDVVAGADRIVLPGDGAFPACKDALLRAAGMQMMATRGMEYRETAGFDWIGGTVKAIDPGQDALKVPHMGWNDLVITGDAHPVLKGIDTGDHAYFVHSYQFNVTIPSERLAHCHYGQDITAIVGRDTMIGTQFHPEKSQAAGLRMIRNFLTWKP